MFAQRAGIKLTHVPFQGTPQIATELMAGRLTMSFIIASSVIGQIAAGQITPLATAANKRSGALPDVPTWRKPACPISTPACGSASSRPPAPRGR